MDRLISAWSKILDMDESEIQESDDFFEIGGDSVMSIRLIGAAEEVGLDIDADTIFKYPILSDMKKHCKEIEVKASATNTSQSSLDHHLVQHCALACHVDPALIEDIFPCANLQTALLHLHLSAEKPGSLLKHFVFELEGTNDASNVKAAFQAVRDKNQALRSRLVRYEDYAVQVVLHDQIHWETSSNLDEYLAHDISTRMNFGDPLTRYAIVQEGEKTRIVWTTQHCVEDEWTRNLLLDGLEQFLLFPTQYSSRPKPPSNSGYVSYLSSILEEGKIFWQRYMNGCPGRGGYWNASQDYISTLSKVVTRQLEIPSEIQRRKGMPLAIIAHGAFGLACTELTGHLDDVAFMSTRTGRQIPVKGIELMMGPMLCLSPLRVRPPSHGTILEMLEQIQRDSESMRPYEPLSVAALGISTNSIPIFNWRMNDSDIYDRKIDFEVGGSKASLRVSRDLSPPWKFNIPCYVGTRVTNEMLDIHSGYDSALINDALFHQFLDRFLHIFGFILKHSLHATIQDVLEGSSQGSLGTKIG